MMRCYRSGKERAIDRAKAHLVTFDGKASPDREFAGGIALPHAAVDGDRCPGFDPFLSDADFGEDGAFRICKAIENLPLRERDDPFLVGRQE